jgi:hypothetical protein
VYVGVCKGKKYIEREKHKVKVREYISACVDLKIEWPSLVGPNFQWCSYCWLWLAFLLGIYLSSLVTRCIYTSKSWNSFMENKTYHWWKIGVGPWFGHPLEKNGDLLVLSMFFAQKKPVASHGCLRVMPWLLCHACYWWIYWLWTILLAYKMVYALHGKTLLNKKLYVWKVCVYGLWKPKKNS